MVATGGLHYAVHSERASRLFLDRIQPTAPEALMTDSAYPTYFNETHQMARDTARRFIEQEVKPHIAEWEEAGTFPR